MTTPYYTSKDGEDLLTFLEKSQDYKENIAMYKMNLMKYSMRFDKKNGAEDLDKIIDYAQRCKSYIQSATNEDTKVVVKNG